MTDFKSLLISRDAENAAVAILTLNRPEAMNSFNLTMHRELQQAYADLDADSSVRVIVVTGAGRAFCAGADISSGFDGAGLSAAPTMHEDVARDAVPPVVTNNNDDASSPSDVFSGRLTNLSPHVAPCPLMDLCPTLCHTLAPRLVLCATQMRIPAASLRQLQTKLGCLAGATRQARAAALVYKLPAQS